MNEYILPTGLRNELCELIQNSVRTVLTEHVPLPSSRDKSSDELPVDIKTASKLIGLSVPTVYGLVHRREIPVNKRRGKLLFFKKDLLEWVRSGRRMTKEEIHLASLKSNDR